MRTLFVLLGGLWASALVAQPADSTLFYVEGAGLWTVHSTGAVTAHAFDAARFAPREVHPSPQGRYLAFVPGEDAAVEDVWNAWLFDVATGEARPATRIGRGAQGTLAPVQVRIEGWTWSGDRLLYRAEALRRGGLAPPPGFEEGYFACEVATEANEPIDLNGTFVAALPGGELLVADAAGAPVRVALDAGAATASLKPPDVWWLERRWENDDLRLVKINLTTGATEMLAVPSVYGFDYTLSPSGASLAFVAEGGTLMPGGTVLFVDGQARFKAPAEIAYAWIGSEALVVYHPEAVVVLDAHTGAERGRYPLD